MRITVAGTGYVGLVSGVCLASTGNTVIGYDIDSAKVTSLQAGQCPIFEPGLAELLTANAHAGRLTFTDNLDEALASPEVVLVAIGTPPRPDGSADMSQIFDFAGKLADRMTEPTIMAIKSTVPVGTGDRLERIVKSRAKVPIPVVSNPEFLKEGSAVNDFLKPDRVLIGTDDAQTAQVIRELHLAFVRNNRPILVMSRRAAEMSKYAANACLAARISLINEIANLCDATGVDVEEVRRGMGTDARIGFQFLYPGAGYGGSCFPKDVQALAHVAREAGINPVLLDAVHNVNKAQKNVLYSKIRRRFGDVLHELTFALWGVTFKPATDDLREAPALVLIDQLLQDGAAVRAHDPAGLPNLQGIYDSRVSYHHDPYEALSDADALVICTEWNEFRSPDFPHMKQTLRQPIIFDGRNLYDLEAMKRHEFEYHPIGRPTVNWTA